MKNTIDKYTVLSKFHEILSPQLYLEIGVRAGNSLKLAKGKAVGVDLNPIIRKFLSNDSRIYRMTSDEFFKKDRLDGETPDLVFIAGEHLFEYVLRDFRNVERIASSDTKVILDDVFPFLHEQGTRIKNTVIWTGDVWKIIPILKKYRPDLDLIPLDVQATGLLLVSNLDSKNQTLWEKYDEIVEEWKDQSIPDYILHREGSFKHIDVLLKNLVVCG